TRIAGPVFSLYRNYRSTFPPRSNPGISARPQSVNGRGRAGMKRGAIISVCLLCAACRPDMANQPRAKPLSQSDFFSDGTSARQPPPDTVPRGKAREDSAFYTGLTNGVYVTQLPMKLTPELLNRGRERF